MTFIDTDLDIGVNEFNGVSKWIISLYLNEEL